MYSSVRALLVATAIVGVMALLSPVAHADTADIDITRAEVQWDDAVVMGRGAAPNDYIYWEGGSEPVIRASKRGKFSFRGTVPSDCEGALSTGANPIPDPDPEITPVSLSNCTSSDPDDPDDPDVPDDPPGADPELTFYGEQTEAHGGDAVRAVGFVAGEVGGVRVVRVISGGDDAFLRSWSWTEDTETEDTVDLNPEVSETPRPPRSTISSRRLTVPVVAIGEGGWNGGPGSDTLRIWDC